MATPDRLIAGYQTATTAIRDRVLKYTAAVWSSSAALRDADVARIVARIIPAVRAGQVQVAQLTDVYIGRMSALAGVTWTAGVDRALVDYRGVPFETVYRRPAVTTYTALSGGATYPDAVKQGGRRLAQIVATDIQQVKNRQASRSIGGSGFKYFRRELTGRENCALCVIASTQRYWRGDLLPIHPDCDCDCVPYESGRDPGQVLDRGLLDMTYAEVDKRADDARREGVSLGELRDLIIVNDHGELGPTLGWASDKFTSAADLVRH